MANAAQLEILKQGVAVWNQWRQDHPDEKIDLRGAGLREADLIVVDLHGADLREADLWGAKLTGAKLSEADLRGANLSGAYLRGTDLSGANLEGGDLSGVRLREANLCKACLCGVDLRRAILVQTNLSQVNITGVNLYGTARDDWKIDGILCEYVFWDKEGEERTPRDRDFKPGEFEELYKQLPTFEYVFEHGFTPLDAVVMDRIVAGINAQHSEFNLVLKNFEVTGTPHATFTVLHREYVETAQIQVTTTYERRIIELEAQKDQLMQVIKMLGSGGITIQSAGRDVIIHQAGGDIVSGNKDQRAITTGRDYLEHIDRNAQVTTGNSGQANEVTDMNQLTTKEALQEHYQLLSEKINMLRSDRILATDTAIKFKLTHQIQEAEAMLEQIEQRLTEFEGNQTPQKLF
jgi:archaellum component FlaC